MNTTTQNKALVAHIHAELDRGNGQAFIDSLADDACWTLEGTTPWSRTFAGKTAIREELIKPLFGDVPTRAGQRYNNRYYYVYRLEGGKVKELTEYFDTALVQRALEAPPWAAQAGHAG